MQRPAVAAAFQFALGAARLLERALTRERHDGVEAAAGLLEAVQACLGEGDRREAPGAQISAELADRAERNAHVWPRGLRLRAERGEGLARLGVVGNRGCAQRRQIAREALECLAHEGELGLVEPRAVALADERQEELGLVRYCSHTGVSTRSKFGCSLKPCTRFRWTMTCLPWSTKIHGASSTTSFCASL